MNLIKQKVIDYYENLKYNLDIWTESNLLHNNFNLKKQNEINTYRDQLLLIIDSTINANLNFLKSNKSNITDHPYDYFCPKFCFLLIRNKYCHLVITSRFIPQCVCKCLNDESGLSDLTNKQNLIKTVILILIANKKKGVIDLSLENNYELDSLQIQLEKQIFFDDLNDLKYLINIEKLKSINFYFNRKQTISDQLFDNLSAVKKLALISGEYTTYENSCLGMFSNLEEVLISNGKNSCELNFEIFKNLKKLRQLKLANPIQSFNVRNLPIRLEKFHLQGLDELLVLDFGKNKILNIDPNVFLNVRNLVYLNMAFYPVEKIVIDAFNMLKNLEYLNLTDFKDEIKTDICPNYEDLNLPKLKYLGIKNRTIPEFKHLNLIYLKLNGMEKFDEKLLKNQRQIIGFTFFMSSTVLNELKTDSFSQFKHLKCLIFRINDQIDYFYSKPENFFNKFLRQKNVFCSSFENFIKISTYENIEDVVTDIGFSNIVQNALLSQF